MPQEATNRNINTVAVNAPVMSVVIAAYNDKEHLPDAMMSVLNQTLRAIELIVVDDASTDGTYETAKAIALTDDRVQVLRMEKNTGGAGAPRNRGISAAVGEYVTFLDSDDHLERHACANLARAGLRDGSDVVLGKVRRFDVKTQKASGWYHRLFIEPRTLDSVEEFPDIAMDTSISKACRREFLEQNVLTFPEDIHYEDLVFAAEVYQSAKKITLITDITYIWNLYPEATRKSITHQRDSINNLDFRIEALNRIFTAIDAQHPLFHRQLLKKVIVHDAQLYVNDIVDLHNDEFALQIIDRLIPLLNQVPIEIIQELEFQRRLIVAAVLSKSPKLIREAMETLRLESDISGDLSEANQQYIWEREAISANSDTALAISLVTFPKRDLDSIPWHQFRYRHTLLNMKRLGNNRLRIIGRTEDPINSLARLTDASWTVRIYERAGLRRFWTFPLESTFDEATRTYRWESTVSMPTIPDTATLPRMSVRIDITVGPARNIRPLIVTRRLKWKRFKLDPTGWHSWLFNSKYQPYATLNSALAFRPSPVNERRKQLRTGIKLVTYAHLLRERYRYDTSVKHESKFTRMAYALFRLLPMNPKTVLVETNMGQSPYDSPGEIRLELEKTSQLTVEQVRSDLAGSTTGFGSNVVRKNSWQYYHRLATSKYLIDNQTLPRFYKKRAGQIYVQTWHGIPLKKMGLDQFSNQVVSKAKIEEFREKNSYWDYLTTPSLYFAKVFTRAFETSAKALPTGSPRNDRLVNPNPATVTAARTAIGVDFDRKSVLYAPTFRDGHRGPVALELDLDLWVQEMADQYQLLLRPHYLNSISVPRHLRQHVIDTSNIADTTSVLLAADLVITDYSSIMFDYATLDRPQVLYTYDLDRYSSAKRGTYFDVRNYSPGPLTFDQQSLMARVREQSESDTYSRQRSSFREKFCGVEPGDSAMQTVATVWGREK